MIYSCSNTQNRNLLRNSQIDQECSMKNWDTKGINNEAEGYRATEDYF